MKINVDETGKIAISGKILLDSSVVKRFLPWLPVMEPREKQQTDPEIKEESEDSVW